MSKINMALLKGIEDTEKEISMEAQKAEDTRKPLNEKESEALKYYRQYKSGTITQDEIAKKVGWKDKSSVSRAFARIEKEYPELLQEPDAGSGSAVKDTEGQQETKTADMPQEERILKIEYEERTAQEEREIKLVKPEPKKSKEIPMEITYGKAESQGKIEVKIKKQVFSFRAGIDDITRWKAYATATGQTMESVGNAAMTEFLKNHPLTENEKVVFDALTASVNK